MLLYTSTMASDLVGSLNTLILLAYRNRLNHAAAGPQLLASQSSVDATTKPDTGSTPIPALLWTVFASILEVFILCFAGWVLARRGIIDKKTQKQLNRVNVNLFTPSLLFSKVAFSLTPQKLKELWIIPIFFIVVTAVSAAVAWLLSVIFRLKRTQRNFAMAASMFNNSNSLPIALMQSLVLTVKGLKWGNDDDKDAMLGRALSYLVVYSTLGMMVRWSFGVHLLSQSDEALNPDPEHVPTTSDSDSASTASGIETAIPNKRDPKRTSVSWNLPGIDDNATLGHGMSADLSHASSSASLSPVAPRTITHPPPRPPRTRETLPDPKFPNKWYFYSFPNTPTRSRVDLPTAVTPSGLDGITSPNPAANLNDEWGNLVDFKPADTRWTRFKTGLRKFWKGFNEFMTVPLWAALASLLVACVQPFQHALDQHMQPVKGALVAAGNCSIPVTLLVLGAYFYAPPPPKEASEVDVSTPPLPRPVQQPDTAAASPPPSKRSRLWTASELTLSSMRKKVFGPSDASRKGETVTVFVSIVSRMLLAPALILPAMAAISIFDIQPILEDPVFVVSMVLLVSSPPALTLAQITQAASGDAFERLISKTIFWSYCIFTPPLTILYVVLGLLLSKL